jgi:hypothetical protein
MNRKQRNTYEALFAEPIRRNLAWLDVVSLIKAVRDFLINAEIET